MSEEKDLTSLVEYDMIVIMDITQEILNLRLQYRHQLGLCPEGINNGECSNFADDIADMGFGQAIWGDDVIAQCWSADIENYPDWFTHFAPIHCFIWYKDKFYDSECSEGCKYADELPIYQRQKEYIEIYT